MIYLYSGTPGSGKSLHQASDIYYWLRAGHPCICNFDINLKNICSPSRCGEFYYISNDILTPELLIKYSRLYFANHKYKEGAIRIYIDECQILFNSRDWQSKGRRDWLSFFTQHRKYGFDIYLVAQFDKMLDKQLRALIEYEVVHRKVKNYGKFGFIANLLSGGSLFVAVKVWYPMHERVSADWYKGTKKLFSIYDTYNTFGVF